MSVYGTKTKKRFFCAALAAALWACLAASVACAGDPTVWDGTSFDTGWYDGHEDDEEFEISTAGQLAGLARLMDGIDGPSNPEAIFYPDMTIRLTADLDMTAEDWIPIGKIVNPLIYNETGNIGFKGTFDGQGHTIKYERNPIEGVSDFDALFSVVGSTEKNGGVVRNLSVEAKIARDPPDGDSGKSAAGGVALINLGEISGCHVSADITGPGRAGGVVALNVGLVKDCSVSADIKAFNPASQGASIGWGGIAGYVGFGTSGSSVLLPGEIRGCTFSGEISVTAKSQNSNGGVGGIAGIVNTEGSVIDGCRAGGRILSVADFTVPTQTGNPVYAGGIVGNFKGSISNCEFDGYIKGDIAGGIAGRTINVPNYPHIIENCVASVDMFAERLLGYIEIGGILGDGDAANSSIENCFSYGKIRADLGGPSANNSGVDIGGISGYSNFIIKNCVSSVDIDATIAKSSYGGEIGGISAGYFNFDITNSVSLGAISVDVQSTFNATDKLFVGGLVGRTGTTDKIYQNNAVLSDIRLNDASDKAAAGALIGCVASTTHTNLKDNAWLAGDTINNGLKYFAESKSGSLYSANGDVEDNTNKKAASESAMKPTAALLSPVRARVGAAGQQFAVTVYPQEATDASNISGEWISTPEDSLSVSPAGLNAAVTPLALGDAEVAFQVAATDNQEVPEPLGDEYVLWGSATPRLAAYVAATDVPAAKHVTVGPQGGSVSQGVAGSVTFAVTTGGIADGSYTPELSGAPAGVTPENITIDAGGHGTLTLHTAVETPEGQRPLKVTIDGAESSEFNLNVGASDTTPPALTAGTATRESDTSATVKFTSGEAGQYYYEIVGAGAGTPTISTSGEGTPCVASENTISLTELTAGAKDIYIVVKDAAGNESETLKIVIGAYTAPDTAAPALTQGAATRESDGTATVSFTSDEAGTYYYTALPSGAAAPGADAIVSGGTSGSCAASANTVNLNGLSAGEKKIYIVLKDAADNRSGVYDIVIPAYQSGGGDTTAPALTNGAASRTGETTATATFTSSEDGTYYYTVAADGAAAPTAETIVASGTSGNSVASANTVYVTGLGSAGAKDMYVVLKDAADNVSEPYKIAIPAYTSGGGATPPKSEVSEITGIGQFDLGDGVESNVMPEAMYDGNELPEELLEYVDIPLFADPDTPITVKAAKLAESIAKSAPAVKDAVDADGATLPLPVVQAAVSGRGLTALVTFKADLTDFAGKTLGDLIVLKLLNDGTAEAPARVNRLADIAAGKYIFTDGYGANMPDSRAIAANAPYCWLSVGVKDESKYDWHPDPADSDEHIITDPLTIALRKDGRTAAPTDTGARIWTAVSGGAVRSADASGSILVPNSTDITSLPVWVAPESAKATVSPDASGDRYDFTNPRTFRVTAEDGVTSKDYRVTVLTEGGGRAGTLVRADDLTEWETYVIFGGGGNVYVQTSIPMSGTAVPDAITASTRGFDKATESFLIIASDGDVVKDYKDYGTGARGAGGRTITAPYTLIFSANSPSVKDYEGSVIYSFTYTLGGVDYTQKFGAGDAGVSVYRETTVEEENPYIRQDDDEETLTPAGGGSGDASSGCDSGALAALALAVGVMILGKKRKP
jgi:hypothetical protein